jgi:hypothetical protein
VDTAQATLDNAGRRAEAARYALLRRLAFAMRHQMVVHLQPIGMITEVMERRLRMAAPDVAQIHDSMGKINALSRAAVQSCLDVVAWLAPEDGTTAPLDGAAQECVDLLRSNFSFRGFAMREGLAAPGATVARAALRAVLPACLLSLTDHAQAPAEVIVTTAADSAQASVTVEVKPGDGPAGFAGDPPYRLVAWREVEDLARAEGVALAREGDRATLAFALLRP